MTQPNIFEISASARGPEDRFTASLHYLIDNVPAVGQSMVDVITLGKTFEGAVFLSAEDHPLGDSESKPDFLLRCEGLDILLEHKLRSQLGERQLERYLELDAGRYLALISNTTHEPSADTLAHPRYLRPHESPRKHFVWEDFYPAINDRGERLAQEFAQYMASRGLAPARFVASWVNLFQDAGTAAAFYERTRELRKYCVSQGASCVAAPGNLAFQVRGLLPWLPLVYFSISKYPEMGDDAVEGPYLTARVYVDRSRSDVVGRFAGRRDSIDGPAGRIWGRSLDVDLMPRSNSLSVYQVAAHLPDYLLDDVKATEEKLAGFGRLVRQHVQDLGGLT